VRGLLVVLLLAGPLLGQAGPQLIGPCKMDGSDCGYSATAPSGLTSGRVTLSTGATTVGDDAGCTWTGTGASFKLVSAGSAIGAGVILSTTPPTDVPVAPQSIQNSVVAGTIAGTFRYAATWTSAYGLEESALGTASAPFTPDGSHSVYVGQPSSPPSWATGWRLYRTKNGPGATYYEIAATSLAASFLLDNADDSALVVPGSGRTSSIARRIYIGSDPFALAAYGNVAWGLNALQSTLGEDNTAIGAGSLGSLSQSGYQNVAVGALTLTSNTSGYKNTALGYGALSGNTVGRWNTAVGLAALQNHTTGDDNTAVGDSVLNAVTTGSHNTGIGFDTLVAVTTGSHNTAIGGQAGHTASGAASDNVFLGYNAGYYETQSGRLFIDNASRASEADARVKALVYGVFSNDPSTQVISLNALTVMVPYLPAYANNAAAIAVIPAGALYYTDVAGEYVVKVAH